MKFFKQKISSVLAIAFVIVFGYFSIFLMQHVFNNYAQDELIRQISELQFKLSENN